MSVNRHTKIMKMGIISALAYHCTWARQQVDRAWYFESDYEFDHGIVVNTRLGRSWKQEEPVGETDVLAIPHRA